MRWFSMAALTLISATSVFAPAFAAKEPVLIEGKFANDIPTEIDLKLYSQKCLVKIDDLADMRSDKKVVGVFGKRAIMSPDDNMAWINSMVQSLATRNINILDADDPELSDAIIMDLHLSKAWINNTDINISANIVFKMNIDNVETMTLYRGNNSRSTFWSGGGDKMQKALDVSIANALDKMAISLHDACNKNKPSGNLAENIIEI